MHSIMTSRHACAVFTGLAIAVAPMVLAQPALQARPTPAAQLVFAGSADNAVQEFNQECSSKAQVTITVPRPGTIKVDAQVEAWTDFAGPILPNEIHFYLESSSGTCIEALDAEGGYSPWSWVPDGDCANMFGGHRACELEQRQMSLSRTFKVASAGTYTFYLNGWLGGSGLGGSLWTTMQALYFPDL